jgi:hypothetical protein
VQEQQTQVVVSVPPIDRARIERDLRALTDALMELVPQQLRTFTLPAPVAAYLKMRGMAMGVSGSLDLTSTAYATCSAIAALPDEDLRAILELVDREAAQLLGAADVGVKELTPREREAIAKVLGELRRGRA